MTQPNPTRPADARLQAEHLERRDTPAIIGGPDTTFADIGAVDLVGTTFQAVAVQADGKVLAAGTDGSDFVVARYNRDGTPDTTFDADGVRTIDVGGPADAARTIAVQADGKIVVVGTNGTDAAVVRLRADGTSDTSFNGTGLQVIDFGPGADEDEDGIEDAADADAATAVAIQPNGRIVVAGTDGKDFAFARLNPADGSLDTTFNGTGVKVVDIGGKADVANAVVIHGNGTILAAGTNGTDMAFARVTTDGATDTSLDADGKMVRDGGGGADAIHALTLQPNGMVVAAGTNGADFVVMRLDPANGSFDNSFDKDGTKLIDIDGADAARAVAVQADGRIVVAGGDGDTTAHAVVARLNADGTLDTAFAENGIAVLDLEGAGSAAGVAVTADKGIVVAGKAGADGFVSRLSGAIGLSSGIAVGGSRDGTAQVYTPTDAGTGFDATAETVAVFGSIGTNVRTATGDVDGDGVADTVLVTGPGTRLLFAVVSGKDNRTALVGPTVPFSGSENFTGGGFAAVGDLDHDGKAEIVITPDQGGGSRVSVFSLTAGGLAMRANFLGITDDPEFRGGARAAVGDVDGDGNKEIIVAAGFEGGPRVAVYDGDRVLEDQTKLVNDFFAFPGDDAESLRNGAFVTAGDLNGDGTDDLIFGGGPGGAPRVFALSGQLLTTQGPDAAYGFPLANFFVNGNTADRGGVRVTAVDVNGDDRADLAVGSGDGLPGRVRVYLGDQITPGGEPPVAQTLDPFASNVAVRNGVFVG